MIMYWPTCLLFDYVILWLCLLVIISYVFLWLCFPNIYISIFSLFYFKLFSSNFKLYLFLTTNENTLFSNIEGRFFTFVFAPCVPSVNPRFTLSVTPLSVFIRFCCHFFALCSHSVPDHSSMSSHIFINSFILNCPKYWCFCLLHHLSMTHMPTFPCFCSSFVCLRLGKAALTHSPAFPLCNRLLFQRVSMFCGFTIVNSAPFCKFIFFHLFSASALFHFFVLLGLCFQILPHMFPKLSDVFIVSSASSKCLTRHLRSLFFSFIFDAYLFTKLNMFPASLVPFLSFVKLLTPSPNVLRGFWTAN